jgi:hypothetical protein
VPIRRAVTLPALSSAPRAARLALSEVPGVSGEVAYRALLLASEIVTAFVEHAADPRSETISVVSDIDERRLHVQITGPRPGVLNVHGQHIVERIADRWGVDPGDNESVWFEVDVR